MMCYTALIIDRLLWSKRNAALCDVLLKTNNQLQSKNSTHPFTFYSLLNTANPKQLYKVHAWPQTATLLIQLTEVKQIYSRI